MAQQNYKIFINGHTVIFTNNEQIAHKDDSASYKKSELTDTVYKLCSGYFKGCSNLVFVSDDPSGLFNRFKKHFKLIKAAGGVVFNELGELLLIRRMGLWDLPKGKLEPGENQRLAALREVHEECGLNFLGILNKIGYTYHAYRLKGRWILKRCTWYRMSAWGDISVRPQLEEDITEVRWVDSAFIKSKDFETYDSLQELFAVIEFPKIRKQV